MAVDIAGQRCEALENIGESQIRLVVGGAGERPVGVAVRLLGLTLGDRNARTRR